MESIKSFVLHVAAVAVIGASGGGSGVQAARTAPGYVIAEVEVTDAAAMQSYGARVPGTLAPFKGRFHYLVRTGTAKALEGEAPRGIVVIAFDSVKQAQDWYDSPAYQAIKPIRQRAAKSRIFIAEGVASQ
ncbi:MAG TPA: DUF1330 domain-containing protein [Myxococcaceae bacterium]|jgi:uncharacterized protein (DUF1330 family)